MAASVHATSPDDSPSGSALARVGRRVPAWVLPACLWSLLVVTALWSRPLLVVDETRYLSVAWEMWIGGGELVPHLNGALYSDKPPLLFWLIQLSWAAGVSETAARLVSPLFGLGLVFLTVRLARRLWPDDLRTARTAPLVLLGSALFAVYTTLTLFDTLLGVFVVVAMLGLLGLDRTGRRPGPDPGTSADTSPTRVSIAEQGRLRSALLLAAGVGLGILTKGPVVLLHLGGPLLLARFWREPGPRGRSFARNAAVAIAAGVALALLWVIPAAVSGGGAYTSAILWKQTAGRVAHAFAHRRPLWWYLVLLPFLLFPWAVWPPCLRGLRDVLRKDGGARFCAAWIVFALAGFSLVSGKQVHYLLPELPAVALLATRVLFTGEARSPRRRDAILPAALIALAGVVVLVGPHLVALGARATLGYVGPGVGLAFFAIAALVLALGAGAGSRERGVLVLSCGTIALAVVAHVGSADALHRLHDATSIALHLGALEREGHALACAGRYQGEFGFLGRLRRPLEVVEPDAGDAWLASHPGGRLLAFSDREPPDGVSHEFVGRLGEAWVSVRASPGTVRRPSPGRARR